MRYPNQNRGSIAPSKRNCGIGRRFFDWVKLTHSGKLVMTSGNPSSAPNVTTGLEEDIWSSNSRELWQGLNKITNYKPKSKSLTGDLSLPERLITFYGHFDEERETPLPVLGADTLALVIIDSDTAREFSKLDMRKAAGPDGITPRLLSHCSGQLAHIFTFIFNWSLSNIPRRYPVLFLYQNVPPYHV